VRPDYSLAFLTGVLGGVGHCVGMCGPLVSSFALLRGRESAKGFDLLPHVLYSTGRITTYAFIGSLMGMSASFVQTAGSLAGLQDIAPLLAGALMVLMGVSIVIPRATRLSPEGWCAPLLRAAQPILDNPSSLKYYPLGLLMGFLPCGLSYSIFVGAAASGGMVEGMLLALAFGLGTAPALIAVGALMGLLGARLRGVLYRLGGVVVIVMGILYIKRGLASYAQM
jgi:hypothetical protein